MNRRDFLRVLGIGSAAAAAATILPTSFESAELDPERLLWKPGAKTFFLPGDTAPRVQSPRELKAGDVVTIKGVKGEFVVNPGGEQGTIWLAGRPSPGIVRVTTNRGYGVDYNQVGRPVACWTEPDRTLRDLRDLPVLRSTGRKRGL